MQRRGRVVRLLLLRPRPLALQLHLPPQILLVRVQRRKQRLVQVLRVLLLLLRGGLRRGESEGGGCFAALEVGFEGADSGAGVLEGEGAGGCGLRVLVLGLGGVDFGDVLLFPG